MKISARNILKGKVEEVTPGSVNAVVSVVLDTGQKITAMITAASADALGLTKGMTAFAIIKASEVMIGTGIAGARISARNVLDGTVSKLVEGAVNDEMTLELDGGAQIVAIITKNSTDALGLQVGSRASAVIKASNTMIGV